MPPKKFTCCLYTIYSIRTVTLSTVNDGKREDKMNHHTRTHRLKTLSHDHAHFGPTLYVTKVNAQTETVKFPGAETDDCALDSDGAAGKDSLEQKTVCVAEKSVCVCVCARARLA